jgi:hypothetical protein
MIATLTLAGAAAGPASRGPLLEYNFHSVVPLGVDALQLEPAKKTVYLLASAESPAFEGMKRLDDGNEVTVTAADGETVSFFPQTVDFRITASAKKKKFNDSDVEPYPVQAGQAVNDYLLNLKFRLKIFHGIDMRVIEPSEVKLIGVPGDVPYNERVYRASFSIGKVPVEDRMMLEILAPSGERISKFHLEFY